MASHSYALVTPSFRGDFDRCRVLIESVDRWVAAYVRHYLVIDRRDVPLFEPLVNSRTEILVVEDIIPWWLFRLPAVRRFWFSLRTLPVRNWILQQIVKLSIPAIIPEDVLLYTDSDTFFVAPYEPRALERDGCPPLFVETGQAGLIPSNDEWHRTAAQLLGFAPRPSYDTNYIGNVIPWRRETALHMQRRVSETAGRPWQLEVAARHAFSEYILYGMFTEQTPEEDRSHWHDNVLRTLNYWDAVPLNVAGLERLKARLEPIHHSVMISAKSRTAVADIRAVFLAQR